MRESRLSPRDLIVIVAARRLAGRQTCFAGIGLPSAAAILASYVHAPDLYLVFESGVLGPRPASLPLSVADEVLASTAQTIVSVPEMFAYWLQPGRIDVGALGAAQVDRFGNINTTVIGPYDAPKVRLPGAGGAPEIAAACAETLILVEHGPRTLVGALDFTTTVGHGSGPGSRVALGFRGFGPRAVITDLAVLEPDPGTLELTVTALHAGRSPEDVRARTGWSVRFADDIASIPPPTEEEVATLNRLSRRMAAAGRPRT